MSIAVGDSTASVYSDILQSHASAALAHLRGTGPESLTTSCIPPYTVWTTAEKELFFHGLAVHSKLRPDLIAEDIQTKSIAEVCAYVDILQQAARDTETSFTPGMSDTTFEVSDKWIQFEEGNSAILARSEPAWTQSQT